MRVDIQYVIDLFNFPTKEMSMSFVLLCPIYHVSVHAIAQLVFER